MFSRTTSGKSAQYLFHENPLVWVEGPDDLAFYREALRDDRCTWKVAGGREECRKLADLMITNGFPYVVTMDGDYEMLVRKRSRHRRVVLLRRYAMENYLCEQDTVNAVCRDCAAADSDASDAVLCLTSLDAQLRSDLEELVILDVAAFIAGKGGQRMPTDIARVAKTAKGLGVDRETISTMCRKAEQGVSDRQKSRASQIVADYLEEHRFLDLLNGHLVATIIRRVIWGHIKRVARRKPKLSWDSLTPLLVVRTWSPPLECEHRLLRMRLKRAVKDTVTSLARLRLGPSARGMAAGGEL